MSDLPRETTYLKTRVYRVTKSYVCLFGFVLAWLNLNGGHFSFALSAIRVPEWITSGASLLISTAVALVDALPGDRLKATLVFWRWQNPLPGSRAFDKSSLERDQRISIQSLRGHLGGKFPRGAQDQNSTWYRLYKMVQSEPAVTGVHYEYLLFRDLTWFSLILALAAFICMPVNWARWHELLAYALVATAAFMLLARAAAERGNRLVRTVLAVIASRPISTTTNET